MITTVSYTTSLRAAWDELITHAPGGNFLQSRAFLEYHGDRFTDHSLVIKKHEKIIAIMPAAIDPSDSGTIVSHPGATYGGLVVAGRRGADEVRAMLEAVMGHYRDLGFHQLCYKAVPDHLLPVPTHIGLQRFLAQPSVSKSLLKAMIPSNVRQALTRYVQKNNLKPRGYPAIPESVRLRLARYYHADNLRLRDQFGVDISGWTHPEGGHYP